MSDIMCENCGKKKAIVHVAALMGDKKVDKWLCEDCAKDFLPFAGGELPLSPELAKNFFEELMKGKKILIVDDVVSLGDSLHALEELVKTAGGEICGRMTILAEGNAKNRDDLIYLDELPLFDKNGNVL